MSAEPRPASRVLLIDERDRLLLIRTRVPLTRDRTVWLTPGAGREPGETFRECAERELFEETGLREVPLSPCVWQRRHVFEWNAERVEARERVYVARVCGTPDVREVVPNDTEDMLEFRWWSIAELKQGQATETFIPRAFVAHLTPILRGDLPAKPLQFGD